MKHRLALILPVFFCMYVACYYAAFLLRCDFDIPKNAFNWFRFTLPFVVAIKFTACLATGEWRRTFRHASLPDLQWAVLGASAASAVLLIAEVFCFRPLNMPIPRSVIVIDWAMSIMAAGLFRMGCRMYTETVRPMFQHRHQKPTLVYGIGPEAIGIVRAVRTGNTDFHVVGLVCDGPRKQRFLTAGIRVYSKLANWGKLKRKTGAAFVLVPGSVPGGELREVTELAREHGLKVFVIPQVQQIVDDQFRLAVRDVTITDLLRRQPAQLDMASIQKYTTGRRVLVTGAAGSIGSELCRQILRLNPSELVLVDQSEFGMFNIERELHAADHDVPLHYVIADVTNADCLRRVFRDHLPELVFHAAAYKHVPLMEENPREAVRNNVGGTKVLVDLSSEFGVERFVLISTDKAVRPTSVMGATKLVSEKYVQTASVKSKTRFVTVRFGNVLNSAGSVVPTFRKQIAKGGPVTVTHPEMTRFFMTIPEAVQLVLQAGAIGHSGDILILEMGDPVKIVDLAKDMIALSGLRYPEDIDIRFTGVRPGEKLYEELFYLSEEGTKKVHDKIFQAHRDLLQLAGVKEDIDRLLQSAHGTGDAAALLWNVVQRIVEQEQSTGIRNAA